MDEDRVIGVLGVYGVEDFAVGVDEADCWAAVGEEGGDGGEAVT